LDFIFWIINPIMAPIIKKMIGIEIRDNIPALSGDDLNRILIIINRISEKGGIFNIVKIKRSTPIPNPINPPFNQVFIIKNKIPNYKKISKCP